MSDEMTATNNSPHLLIRRELLHLLPNTSSGLGQLLGLEHLPSQSLQVTTGSMLHIA
jgi:hypothetical protein